MSVSLFFKIIKYREKILEREIEKAKSVGDNIVLLEKAAQNLELSNVEAMYHILKPAERLGSLSDVEKFLEEEGLMGNVMDIFGCNINELELIGSMNDSKYE